MKQRMRRSISWKENGGGRSITLYFDILVSPMSFLDSVHVAVQPARQAETPEMVHGRIAERQEANDQRAGHHRALEEIQDVQLPRMERFQNSLQEVR